MDDYAPYGILRGGASWHFLETALMGAKTARQYIDQGTLALAKTLWTHTQRRAVRQWSLRGARILRRLRQEKDVGSMEGVKFNFLALLSPSRRLKNWKMEGRSYHPSPYRGLVA